MPVKVTVTTANGQRVFPGPVRVRFQDQILMVETPDGTGIMWASWPWTVDFE